MPAEIQWRLRKAEWWTAEDRDWKHHGMYPVGDVDSLLSLWNGHDPFFEYRRGSGTGPEKEKVGPFPFTFNKSLGNARVITKKKPIVALQHKPHEGKEGAA